jgi:hypothetical protein
MMFFLATGNVHSNDASCFVFCTIASNKPSTRFYKQEILRRGSARRILEAKDAEEQLHGDQHAILATEWEPRSQFFLFGTREIYTERWLDQRGTVFCRYFLEHLESARDALDGFD